MMVLAPAGTVDCEYPRWVEFLCHDISVHVPHHVCSKIPWYNLRAANESLKQNWGQYMTSCTFNWRMMKTIFTGEATRRHAYSWGCVRGRGCRLILLCSCQSCVALHSAGCSSWLPAWEVWEV